MTEGSDTAEGACIDAEGIAFREPAKIRPFVPPPRPEPRGSVECVN